MSVDTRLKLSLRSTLLGLGAMAALSPAMAYECAPVTENGQPTGVTVIWQQRCIPVYLRLGDEDLWPVDFRSAIEDSLAVWPRESCSDLSLPFSGETTVAPGFQTSNPGANRNVITLTDTAEIYYNYFGGEELAITAVHYSPITGEILDADIIINTVDNDFSTGACTPSGTPSGPYDLQNTLVHELGHLIGLDHPPNNPEATMHISAEACETKKQSLLDDDIQGLCDLYPAGETGQTCGPPTTDYDDILSMVGAYRNQCGDCSCRATRRSGPSSAWMWLVMATGLGRRMRRSRPSPSRD